MGDTKTTKNGEDGSARHSNLLCRMCLDKMNYEASSANGGPHHYSGGKRIMTRMDRYQLKILLKEFEKNHNWS